MNCIAHIIEEAALFAGKRALENLIYSTWTSLSVAIDETIGVLSPSAKKRGEPMETMKPSHELQNETPFRNFPMTRALRTDQMTFITEVNTREVLGLEYTNFDQNTINVCFKEADFQNIVISMRCFNASIPKTSKFGVQVWNKSYPFIVMDLTISLNDLHYYLENNDQTTWNDVRNLLGQIMYNIGNDCGRTLGRIYPEVYSERDLSFAPSPDSYILHEHHSNAKIVESTRLKNVVPTQFEIKPRNFDTCLISKNENVGQVLEGIIVTEPFNLMDMMSKMEKLTPYVNVSLRECFRMNGLMNEIRKSLKDRNLALKDGVWKKIEFVEQVLPSENNRAKTILKTPTSVRKAMRIFPKDPYEYHPVLLLNQLIPGIRYNTHVVSNPPPVIDVSTIIDGTFFVGRGSSKKAAMVELAIDALNYFYRVPPSSKYRKHCLKL